jgi:hypothetical protein
MPLPGDCHFNRQSNSRGAFAVGNGEGTTRVAIIHSVGVSNGDGVAVFVGCGVADGLGVGDRVGIGVLNVQGGNGVLVGTGARGDSSAQANRENVRAVKSSAFCIVAFALFTR